MKMKIKEYNVNNEDTIYVPRFHKILDLVVNSKRCKLVCLVEDSENMTRYKVHIKTVDQEIPSINWEYVGTIDGYYVFLEKLKGHVTIC